MAEAALEIVTLQQAGTRLEIPVPNRRPDFRRSERYRLEIDPLRRNEPLFPAICNGYEDSPSGVRISAPDEGWPMA